MKIKKFIALILALTFIFSVFSIDAYAATQTERVYGNSQKTSIRISGTDRYETSINIADKLKAALNVSKFKAIVVAYGRNYADALAGSYLAALTDAPILIVNTDTKNENDKDSILKVKNYINNNLITGGTVYILGGSSVISKDFEDSLKTSTRSVIRLAGDNRYDTNIAILKECKKYQSKPDTVLVCDAYNYADSLSASSLGMPILLIDKQSGNLTSAQKKYLSELKFDKAYILGGTAAVPKKIEKSVKSYCSSVKRISGENRYETSTKIAKTLCGKATEAVIAYGHNFPDGLCGGPLAYAMGSPLILVYNDTAQDGTNLFYAKKYFNTKSIKRYITLGGENAVTKKTESILNAASSNIGAPKVSDIKNMDKIVETYMMFCETQYGIHFEAVDLNGTFVKVENFSTYSELKGYLSNYINDDFLNDFYPSLNKNKEFKEIKGKLYVKDYIHNIGEDYYYDCDSAILLDVINGDTYEVLIPMVFSDDSYIGVAFYFKKVGNNFKLANVKYPSINDISNLEDLYGLYIFGIYAILNYDMDEYGVSVPGKSNHAYLIENFNSKKAFKNYLLNNLVTSDFFKEKLSDEFEDLFDYSGKLYTTQGGFSPTIYLDAERALLVYAVYGVEYIVYVPICETYDEEKTPIAYAYLEISLDNGKLKLNDIYTDS